MFSLFIIIIELTKEKQPQLINEGESIWILWILYGKEFEAYRFLGAHACERGTVFRTFAPNAQRISLIGEFNGWQETPMQKVHDGNLVECMWKMPGRA